MLEFAQTALIYVVPYLLILTVVVTIHELGHFWTARALGTAVDRFSIGFGPKVFSWRGRNGMEWWISAVPLGGYVKFSGEDSVSGVPDSEDLAGLREKIVAQKGEEAVNRYFHFKPVWQRALIVAAGPFANFVLATLLFAGLLITLGEAVTPARIDGVSPTGPAARAGFQVGDIVTAADGKPIRDFNAFRQVVALRAGDDIAFTVKRASGEVVLHAVPVRAAVKSPIGGYDKIGTLGIVSIPRATDVRYIRYGPIEALQAGAVRTWDVVRTTVFYIGRWIRGAENGDQIKGPLGMVQAAGGAAKLGAEGSQGLGQMALGVTIMMINMAAVISVAVGFINLLPVPMLDGGHLLFYAYESAARRPLGGAAQAMGYRVGVALILGLVLFATWNDVQQLRLFQLIGGAFS